MVIIQITKAGTAMNTISGIKVRQLVDWRAAAIAGTISGFIALGMNILLSAVVLDSPWVFIRIIASLVLGKAILPPPINLTSGVFLAALLIHLGLGLIYTALIAAVIHQWGILISLAGGALMGLAFYTINFYFFSILFPWFFAFRNWGFLLTHIVFGAVAGGIYEWLEVEKYIEIRDEVTQ
jgi:hypothetical protein